MKALLKKTLLGNALISFRNKFNGNLTLIEQSNVSQKLLDGWKSADIPNKQGLITNEELSKMYSGIIMKPFQVLADFCKMEPQFADYLRNNDNWEFEGENESGFTLKSLMK